MAARDVDHAVDEGKDRVDVVGDEQHRDALALADAADELGDGLLVVEVEAVQRLVEHQHAGPADQGLGEEDALLLAPGQLADRAVLVGRRADELDDLGDAPLLGRRRKRQSPPGAVEAEPDQVDGADPQVGVEPAALRQVADVGVAPPHRVAEDRDRAVAERDQAQQGFEERRLARAVGTEDGDELALLDLEVDAAPDHATPKSHRGAFEPKGGGHAQEYCTNDLRNLNALSWEADAQAQSGHRRGPPPVRDPGAPRVVDR